MCRGAPGHRPKGSMCRCEWNCGETWYAWAGLLHRRLGWLGVGGAGASAGSGNASREWTEFKRHKRENKHTKARDASTASYGSSIDEAWGADTAAGPAAAASGGEGTASSSGEGGNGGGEDPRWASMPTAGAIVEYPLSQQQKDELQDGRTHGVGLLVGRNCDR